MERGYFVFILTVVENSGIYKFYRLQIFFKSTEITLLACICTLEISFTTGIYKICFYVLQIFTLHFIFNFC